MPNFGPINGGPINGSAVPTGLPRLAWSALVASSTPFAGPGRQSVEVVGAGPFGANAGTVVLAGESALQSWRYRSEEV